MKNFIKMFKAISILSLILFCQSSFSAIKKCNYDLELLEGKKYSTISIEQKFADNLKVSSIDKNINPNLKCGNDYKLAHGYHSIVVEMDDGFAKTTRSLRFYFKSTQSTHYIISYKYDLLLRGFNLIVTDMKTSKNVATATPSYGPNNNSNCNIKYEKLKNANYATISLTDKNKTGMIVHQFNDDINPEFVCDNYKVIPGLHHIIFSYTASSTKQHKASFIAKAGRNYDIQSRFDTSNYRLKLIISDSETFENVAKPWNPRLGK